MQRTGIGVGRGSVEIARRAGTFDDPIPRDPVDRIIAATVIALHPD